MMIADAAGEFATFPVVHDDSRLPAQAEIAGDALAHGQRDAGRKHRHHATLPCRTSSLFDAADQAAPGWVVA
jgi:hypothetical protein